MHLFIAHVGCSPTEGVTRPATAMHELVRATVDAYLIVPALHRCSPNRFRAWELAKMEALQRETFL